MHMIDMYNCQSVLNYSLEQWFPLVNGTDIEQFKKKLYPCLGSNNIQR